MTEKTIFVKDRNEKLILEVNLEKDMTVAQLKQKITQKSQIFLSFD